MAANRSRPSLRAAPAKQPFTTANEGFVTPAWLNALCRGEIRNTEEDRHAKVEADGRGLANPSIGFHEPGRREAPHVLPL